MRLDRIIKSVAPVIAVAAAGGRSQSGMDIEGGQGVPLADLDLAGTSPTEILLAAPDTIRVTQGDRFTIEADGEPAARERMRFALEGGSLRIMRESKAGRDDHRATVNVQIPHLRKITLAGSGALVSDMSTGPEEAVIVGTGRVELSRIAVSRLEVTIAGSGRIAASGSGEALDLIIAGSGRADLAQLKADRTNVEIAGSGSAGFASDGKVTAKILGSGNVTVYGNARCEVQSLGSGRLICERSAAAPEAA